MTTASIQEIKKELRTLDADVLQELCMRLAKYKKENKELLNYLLFEAQNEQAYIENVKEEISELFKEVPASNVYYVKKSLRKILRFTNRQIKYSGVKQTELEVRIFFCGKMKEAKIPRSPGTVLSNLYQQQLKKIESAFAKLPEDIQADYDREMKNILS
jgi:HPt (histidine-containing phosphotransfer) domain-containing protein